MRNVPILLQLVCAMFLTPPYLYGQWASPQPETDAYRATLTLLSVPQTPGDGAGFNSPGSFSARPAPLMRIQDRAGETYLGNPRVVFALSGGILGAIAGFHLYDAYNRTGDVRRIAGDADWGMGYVLSTISGAAVGMVIGSVIDKRIEMKERRDRTNSSLPSAQP